MVKKQQTFFWTKEMKQQKKSRPNRTLIKNRIAKHAQLLYQLKAYMTIDLGPFGLRDGKKCKHKIEPHSSPKPCTQ